MTSKGSPDYMLMLKAWDPGLHGNLVRPPGLQTLRLPPGAGRSSSDSLSARCHFYAELYSLAAHDNSDIEFALENKGEMLRQFIERTSQTNGEACHKFVRDELELKVRGDDYSIYTIDQYQAALLDYISLDLNGASTYLQNGLESLFERCLAIEKTLSSPFPHLEEMEDSVFRIMRIVEPYRHIYSSLKRVLGDKLTEEFENEEVAMVYLKVADASLAEEYKHFRSEMVQPWLDLLHQALVVSQRQK